jgi:hypothetical protein
MTLSPFHESLGALERSYLVQPTGETASGLPPVTLSIQGRGMMAQDYLSSDDARRLAWALIDQANKADVRRGKAGVDPNLVARAEAA